MMEERIQSIIIIEVMGKPAKYIKEAIERIIKRISEEKNVEIINSTINEPKIIDGSKEVYSTFAEVEFSADLITFLRTIFTYMPSHVDIIKPEQLALRNEDLSMVMNEITRRLHQYDEIAKRVSMENNILQEQLKRTGVKSAIPEFIPDKIKKKSKRKKK